ncbi:MAG: class I SAM-dependent methyltransferase [Prolixibacteraceae bacterium]|nr:class I SAM-dependent methyltransferase [Prolixibacteraceae bacterium]
MNRREEFERYISDHIDPEEEVLKELDRDTSLNAVNPRMLSGHLQGQFLAMLSKIICPHLILEVGTFTGYSAICLAKGLQPGGKLITIEINDELEKFASRYFRKAGLENKIEQQIGSAIEIIPTLSETFDLLFLDADKRDYIRYYNLAFPKVRSGGIIIADNTLWGGKVLDKDAADDHQTKGILEFNKMIKDDSRVEKVILPLRDGMTLLRKK